jgi:glycosyltransferase involved in cell wall biosynthesis
MLFRSKRPRTLFFFHETTWSGAPIQLLHLVSWLKNAGWEIAAAVPRSTTPESGPITNRLTSLGIETHPVLDLSTAPNFEALQALSSRFEAIVANTLVMWAPIKAAQQAGIPNIWYIHESLVARQLIEQIPEIHAVLSIADVVVVPTKRTAEIYRPYVDRAIEVVPYGIPPNELTGRRKSNEPTFLLLGSYESRKGQDIFLEAIRQIPPAVREQARFRMAGRNLEPSFFEELRRRASDLPNVELGAALEHGNAREAIAGADVLVCASRDETMPVAILEAMSLAKPVVTTAVGGIAEWLENEKNALVVRPEDAAALAQALQRYLQDAELRVRLGRHGHKTLQRHFSIDRLGKAFARLIKSARRQKHQ